jgi:hypothetical protein
MKRNEGLMRRMRVKMNVDGAKNQFFDDWLHNACTTSFNKSSDRKKQYWDISRQNASFPSSGPKEKKL